MAQHYRLNALLEQRERELEAAEARLVRKRATVQAEEVSRDQARARLEDARSELTRRRAEAKQRQEEGEAIPTQEWVSERHYQQRLADVLTARKEEVRAAEQRLAEAQHTELEARQSLLTAKRDLEVLEKDRDRFEATERRAEERRAEREADDLATARYARH